MSQQLSVNLPLSTVYVSGTVNGVAAVWTNTSGNTWQTTADKALNNTYDIELTIVSSTGQTNTESIRLYYGLNLITDRTAADVNLVKRLAARIKSNTATAQELAQYVAGLKGAYKADDLNRVGAAVEFVAAALTAAGYAFIPTLRTDWTDADCFYPDDLANYLANIEGLRSALAVWPATPATPADLKTYQQANDIEQIIEDVYQAYQHMSANCYYLGDLYIGEV